MLISESFTDSSWLAKAKRGYTELLSFIGFFLTPDAKSPYPTVYPKPAHCYLINLCLQDLRETRTEALYLRLTFTVNSWLFVTVPNFQKAKRYLLQISSQALHWCKYIHTVWKVLQNNPWQKKCYILRRQVQSTKLHGHLPSLLYETETWDEI